MKMEDVKVGMRLRSTFSTIHGDITVTEITDKGFKYRYDKTRPFIARWSSFIAAEGHEHFGFNGEAFFEPVG